MVRTEANNRTAVGSMTAYRALRYGKHVDLTSPTSTATRCGIPGIGPKRMCSTPASRWFLRS